MHIATWEEIKAGLVTDVYFERTVQVLRQKGIRKRVLAEIRTTSLPSGYEWAILAGVEEAARLLEGVEASVSCMEEGRVFHPGEPVLAIEGEYTAWGVLETPLLGLLCQASGVATKAARCKTAAGERVVISFGARRMHPALAPMIERNAFIGGCDGVAVVKSAELIGEPAMGTMPHALILVVGDSETAFRYFHQAMPPEVRRVCLVDTIGDEKFEALAATQALGDALYAVRLDTPGSRRGDIRQILREVRWELDLRGFQQVRLFLSGGLDEGEILRLRDLVDSFGVGTSISNAPVINFSLDIVEVEGRPMAKRGKESGRKQVALCPACGRREVVPERREGLGRCGCGGALQPLLLPLTQKGNLARELAPPRKIREFVLDQIQSLGLAQRL